ncbi:MAG: hypothetical protein Q9218_003642, partial [Villophora microphyllina]
MVAKRMRPIATDAEHYTLRELLMVMLELSWYRLEHLTVDTVTRMVEYIKDSEIDRHDEDLRTYKEASNRNENWSFEWETYFPSSYKGFTYKDADRRDMRWFIGWHDYFTAAVKEAEKLNKAIRHMDTEDLRIILVLVVSTCLGAKDILTVFSFKKNGHPD